MSSPEIPLFPLAVVLFPGATLQLRIFEPRYLDMVSECTRHDICFGVCLLLEDAEGSAPAAIGTLARITDFQALSQGLLGISVTGEDRFHVLRSRIRSDGLIRGTVRPWPAERELPVPPEFSLLPTVLGRLIDQLGGAWASAAQECYDNAGWVGFRLAELLPLQLDERQQLLELTDPFERLRILQELLPRFQRA